ncbi:MAG: energy transducer TonB [Ferruginibacter sp.]|nr:energy transducer TonB [Ferruginibacter sp.]
MKKRIIHLQGKVFLSLLALGFIASCTSNDTDNSSTTTGSTDTAMTVNTDTMMTDQTHVATMDSTHTMVNPDTLARVSRDTSLKLKVDKNKKKGKVTIVAPAKQPITTTMEMDKEGFYKNTEILPAYPGGEKALERFFEKNIVYPDDATENNAEGTVNLTFAVDENGKVYNPVVTSNPVGYGIEAEAIRVFKQMPNWTPGRIKGKNVKTRYTLPIRFQLY